ncbi:sigma-54-dependent transcriptional regulator [Aestuariibacter salexigens]|uniref:sigma-54-dependent transcriptional regulator n=1 Tax=Aestuariibacter salexigens TaxID=226010 RepID=UPI000401D801|nr:sigma-54 dependent transcriptional regulator [Aestuariibacter salexigens]
MKQQGRILIIDDDEDILAAGKLLLKRHFTQVTACSTPESIEQLMADDHYDAILLDMNFGPGESSGEQGFHWLGVIKRVDPQAVVIMITAHGGVNVAVEAMKLGATDYVAKPWENEKLVATLSAAVQLGRSRTEASELRERNKVLAEVSASSSDQLILGNSPAMQDVQSLIDRAAPTDANVLVLGENGTGKELVARALHQRSKRADQVFLSVDLGALSETLFESELFGHKKGAFTGAKEDRVGRFQAASGGTLFLDEIGNLPMHLQAKLLTVLEQREVVPLGANKPIPFDVRIITATNLPLAKLQDESVFRQDLLFRLNTVAIDLPPLRGRGDDIRLIAEHYVRQYTQKYQKRLKPISQSALTAMLQYAWPGNIRALRHATERAVILSESDEYVAQDFQLRPDADAGRPAAENGEPKELNLEKLELQAIRTALKKHRYNISHAAKELGLTRAALYRRMEKHGL